MRLRKPNPTNGRSAAAAADDDEWRDLSYDCYQMMWYYVNTKG
jgi:hypothetical protein